MNFNTFIVSVSCAVLSNDIKLEIVAVHNTLRRNFAKGEQGVTVANMKKFIWTFSVERRARRKLRRHCRNVVTIEDSDQNSNLARTSSGSLESDIRTWYREIESDSFYGNYHSDYGICFPATDCQHATTMLNADSRYIGCAYRRRCGGRTGAFLCLYENDEEVDEFSTTIWGQFYKTGAVCSKCTNETSFCDDGLCTTCDTNPDQCDCRKTCTSAGIVSGVLNRHTCSCACHYGLGHNCDEPCANQDADYEGMDYDICNMYTRSDCLVDRLLPSTCPSLCGLCVPHPPS